MLTQFLVVDYFFFRWLFNTSRLVSEHRNERFVTAHFTFDFDNQAELLNARVTIEAQTSVIFLRTVSIFNYPIHVLIA